MTTRSPKKAKPFVPPARSEPERRAILELLSHEPLSALQISQQLRISEKEVYSHLEHLKMSIHHTGYQLIMVSALCNGCGFRFTKRNRLSKPGKCPLCRGESIQPPLFSREEAG